MTETPADPIHEYFYTLHLRGQGRFDEAIEIYRTRLKSDPSDYKTRWNLAVTLSFKGDNVAALREIRAAVNAEPNTYFLQMTLVDILLKLKKWDEALVAAQALVLLDPLLAGPQSQVGEAYIGLGNLPAAIRSYELAITLTGTMPDTFLTLGELYEKMGRIEESMVACNKAAGQAPGLLQLNLRLADSYAAKGSLDWARRLTQKVLEDVERLAARGQQNAKLTEIARLANENLEKYRDQVPADE